MSGEGLPDRSGTLRFSDCVLDPARRALTRQGVRLKIQPQPFRVLELLVARAPEIVSREDLRQHVWGDDLHVDAELSLNYCIRQIRHVLGDHPDAPCFVETLPRQGYRFIAAIERSAPPAAAASAEDAVDQRRWRMPARLVDLVGRDEDLAGLTSRLGAERLVTLVGPGGVGKTQLALEAARRVEMTFAGGARLVDLAPATGAADVEQLVANAVGAPERQGRGLGASIGSMLRDTNALLVFDNCERVFEPAGRLAEVILEAAPGVHVLATSQQALGATAEILVRVAPLECAEAGEPDRPGSAVRLFERRASAVQPGFDASGPHASTVFQICQRLDGLPLAIELAAAQVRVLGPTQILERLDSRVNLLPRTNPASVTRHRTLGAMFEWSTSLLDPAEEQLLEQVSVFPGVWNLEAAAAVAGRPDDSTTTLVHLTGLVDKSLVFADTSRASARYRLLDSVRLFALERLERSGQHRAVRGRMVAYYAAVAARADRDWYTARATAWYERLVDERPNLRAALAWALETPDLAELGLALATDLRWFWRAAGDFIEGRSWMERALRAAPGAAPATRAHAEIALGQFAHHLSDFDAARAAIDRGLLWFAGQSTLGAAWALSAKAMNEAMLANAATCAEAATSALDIATRLDSAWVGAGAWLARGQLDAMRGEHRTAVVHMMTAYDLSVRADDLFLELYVVTNLGLQHLLAGNAPGSREMFTCAFGLNRRLNNVRAMAGCFEGFGYLAVAAGDARLGARLLGSAERMRGITSAPLLPHWFHAHEIYQRQVEVDLGPEAAAYERAAGAAAPVDELAHRLFV